MVRFLNFSILLLISISLILIVISGGKQTIIFHYINLNAGLLSIVVLGLVRVVIINPFKPKFYRREIVFFSYKNKLPLLRPEFIILYLTLLILYIPQVSNSINLKFGDDSIGLLTLFLIMVYGMYTWSVLVVDLIKQNQLTLLENAILSLMKDYDLYDKHESIEDNLITFTHNIENSYTVDLAPVLKSTNTYVYKLDEYKKTLVIAKQKSSEELRAIWE